MCRVLNVKELSRLYEALGADILDPDILNEPFVSWTLEVGL